MISPFLSALARNGGWSSTRSSSWLALRALQNGVGEQDAIWPADIKLHSREKALEVSFSTGEIFRYPAELLRVESPAAEAPRDRQGRPKVVHGRRHVGILAVEPVGSYAVRLQFDDMHGTGIYTWPFLYDLGRHKLSRCRRYILLLRQRGLSRDPRTRPRSQARLQE